MVGYSPRLCALVNHHRRLEDDRAVRRQHRAQIEGVSYRRRHLARGSGHADLAPGGCRQRLAKVACLQPTFTSLPRQFAARHSHHPCVPVWAAHPGAGLADGHVSRPDCAKAGRTVDRRGARWLRNSLPCQAAGRERRPWGYSPAPRLARNSRYRRRGRHACDTGSMAWR